MSLVGWSKTLARGIGECGGVSGQRGGIVCDRFGYARGWRVDRLAPNRALSGRVCHDSGRDLFIGIPYLIDDVL
jgi:hypothetical protein